MADFLLTIGVDTSLSLTQMQSDINSLITDLQGKTPKIKVGLELDTSAITNLQTQIANLQNLINSSGGSGSGTGGSGSSAAKEYTASLQTVINTYTKMQSLINKNTNAGGLSSWGALSAQARQYADVIKEVETKNISVKEALKNLGIDGKGFIEGASIAMAKFRAEMEATGISGGTSLKDMRIALDQMQMLLNSNSGASGMQSFVTLQNTANLFSEAIRLATTENISLKAALEQVGLSGTTAIDSATAAMTAFKTELAGSTTIKINSPEYFSDLNKVNTLLTQVTQNHTKWTAAKKGDTASHYNKLPEYANQLAVLREELRAGISPDEFNKRFGAILAGVSNVNTVIKSAGKNTLSWGDRIKGLAAKFSSWFSITRVIMAVYRTIRKMITSVIELDTAMTELKKVTNETDAGYSRFLDNATVRAKKLGASLTDVVNATADFARLGYGIKDAEKLADVAIMYKNVGDGIQDISEASESIIATMQAFGITADEAESIVDKFNEVGNNYAISSKGIGDALLRSAAAMHAANNTLDETIALATAANTVVQDPEKVGTTLKTVSMYLRAAKTEAEEAGESTDGMANSVSELREEILSLTGNRVDIQLDDGTFKSTYQILKELSEVWDGLSDITQANIVELVGGKRNANVVSALLENFEVAEKSLETSLNSAGSAARENEKVLESIQGKINKMKAAFQSLSETIFNSGLIKLVVDMLSWIIGATDAVLGFIGALGGLPTVLTMVCSALIMTNNAFLANKAAVVGTFIVQKATALFKGVASAAKLIYSSLISAGTAWKKFATGVYTANQALQASIPVIGLAIGALTLIGSIIGHNIKAEKEAAEAAKERAEEARKNAEETKNNAKELDNLISKYKELAKTGGVSAVDAEEARQIQSDINSLITNQKTQIDLVNGSYDEQIKKLEYIKRLQGNEVADDAYNAYIAHTQSYITSDKAGERGWLGDSTAWVNNHIPWAPAVNGFLGINPTPEDTGYVYYWDSPAFLDGDMNSAIIRQVISGVEGVDVMGDDAGIKWDSTKFTPSEMRDSLQKYVDALDKKAEEIKASGGDASFIYESDEYQTFRRWLGEASKSSDTQKQLAFDVVEGAFSQFTIGEVSSIQGYKDERTALVDNLLKDQRVQHLIKDKIISEEDIQKYVDEQLSIQFPKFAGAIARETSGLKPEAGIGAMKSASEAISTLQEANKQLSEDGYLTTDTLDKIRESANLSGKEWDRYFEKLMNAKAGSAEFNKTLDDLTYKILENELATTGLENATEEQIAAILRENGVANANTVAQQYLARAKFNAKMAGETFKNTTEESIDALVNEGLQCGLTEHQILALIATEIKFNRNDLNVEQKTKALMEVALAAGMAKAQVDALFSGITNSSSGTDKKAWAEANGFDVLDEHTGENWTLDGVNYYSWAYRDRATGVVYDEIEPAQLEHAANETISWLNDKANFITPQYPSAGGGGGSDKNEALDKFLKDAEHRYKIHQDELKYIAELDYALKNLTKTDEERLDIADKINQAYQDLADNRINDIEHQNELLLNQGKKEIELVENYRKIQQIAHEEANRYRTQMREQLLAMGYTDEAEIAQLIENSDYIQEMQNTWWDAHESIKEAIIDTLDLASEKLDSLQSLQESYYEVLNSVAEAQHEITKELEASMTMYEYLDEETRKLLFNQDDYNKLCDELVDIQAQADKLQRRFNQEIQNATADTLDEITSKYQMQYDIMMKQYEIAKAELEVAKKRQQLDNVLNERNVRMFINGQWQWVANTQDVIDAQKELADAEYEAERARNEKAQTESLNKITSAQDKLTTTINQIDSGAINLNKAVGKITSSLREVADKDIPALRGILNAAANTASRGNGGQSSGRGGSSSRGSSNVNAAATTPDGELVPVHIDSNGKTTTPGLPVGTIVHTQGGNFEITGGSAGNYEGKPVDNKYAGGTKRTRSGSALMGEGDKREVFIDSDGRYIPIEQPTIFADIKAGGKVFNGLQLKNLEMLWDLSNMSSLPSMLAGRAQSISTIDNSIHIGGMTIGEQGNEDWINGLRRYVYTHKGSM